MKRPVLFAAALAVVAAAFLLPAGAPSAADKPSWWFHDIVDFKFVEPLAVVPKRDDVMIIDSRPAARMYDVGHIPTAVNILDTEFDKHVGLLPKDKKTLLVFYCQGLECKKSHASAVDAEKLGYTNVKVYAEGYPEWVKNGKLAALSTTGVADLIESGEPMLLIDSRPAKMFKEGSIPTAISIPDTTFDKYAGLLPSDKATRLVFFCGGFACVLSEKSAVKAKALGYTNVWVYPAGEPDWKARYGSGAKLPQVAKAEPKAPVKKTLQVEAGKSEGSITGASFEKLLKENAAAFYLVDVRDEEEVARGTFKGAVNIPIGKLNAKLDTLPTDKPIVFVCATGARSGEAYDMVSMFKQGAEAYYVDAAITHKDGVSTVKGK